MERLDSFRVNTATCRKDGICAAVCPVRIVKGGVGEVPSIADDRTSRCIQCGQCMAFCPTQACAAPGLAVEDAVFLRKDLYPSPEQVEELVFSRRSIRNFTDKPVPREELIRILDAVRFAPTAHNTQNLRWIILESREKTVELVELVIDWFRNLPKTDPALARKMSSEGMVRAWEKGNDVIARGAPQVAILAGREHTGMEAFDAAVALTYLEIVGQAHGVGCCWGGFITRVFSHPASGAVREYLGIAADETPYCAQMMGYPKFKAVSRPPRKELRVTWK